jgi:hypothetical protein
MLREMLKMGYGHLWICPMCSDDDKKNKVLTKKKRECSMHKDIINLEFITEAKKQ